MHFHSSKVHRPSADSEDEADRVDLERHVLALRTNPHGSGNGSGSGSASFTHLLPLVEIFARSMNRGQKRMNTRLAMAAVVEHLRAECGVRSIMR